ncbi:hypothetical protein [Pseudooceanicola sp.]|uniref:hypothetical protein n=1 Tax=Pseudooceanicola sp. TaxID=1914328 RepID=UPI0035168179
MVDPLSHLSRALRAWYRETTAAISVGFMILLPGLLMIAGVAIDFSVLNAQRKFIQSQADMAALSGIRNLHTVGTVHASATETLMSEVFFDMRSPLRDEIQVGILSETHDFVASADQSTLENVSAVKVIAAAPAAMPILSKMVGGPNATIRRKAIAVAVPRVSFGLSNCLASLDLLNGLVAPMLGLQADALCSGHGVRIHTFELLGRLALRGALVSPGRTYAEILDAEFTMSDVLTEALVPEGFTVLTGPLSNQPVRLGDFIYLSEDLSKAEVGSPVPPLELNAADIVFGSAEVLGTRIVDLELTADLGILANVPVKLQISEPRQIVIGARPGDEDAVARTSQIRLSIEGAQVAGLLDLSLNLGVANATATLHEDGEHCSSNPDYRAAVFRPATASLIDLDLSVLGLPPLNLLPPVAAALQAGGTSETVTFSHEDVEKKRTKTVAPSIADMVNATHSIIDLPLGAVAPDAGDLAAAIVEDLLGLRIAEAQLEVFDLVCTRRLAG